MSSRRRFLAGAGAALAVGAVGCSGEAGSGGDDDHFAAGGTADHGDQRVVHPFRGPHQAGVTAPLPSAGLVAGLDVRADDRDGLAEVLAGLGRAAESLMAGEPPEERDGGFPPVDTGIVGPEPGPLGLTVVVGYGHTLFDDRFGLAGVAPQELQPMPHFANDRMVTDDTSHGDLSIAIDGASGEAVVHAFRQLLRATRGQLRPRWMRQGFADLLPDRQPGEAPMRNLMGFKDGTANPDTSDASALDEVVWIGADDGQPDWVVGGAYQAIRVIRMQVEFWDRTRLNEQEAIFGRRRGSGAPLGAEAETDEPVDVDPTSHIGRAAPLDDQGRRRITMLRRGLNYAGGFDDNGQLDQGLIFASYQRSLEDGFLAAQRRLDGEALEEYIRPLGGGLFVVPPPPAEGDDLGAALLA